MLRRYETTLDSVYNFDDVILRRPGSQIIMRPPVVSEAEMAMALGDGGQIARETACVYSITKIAQLSSAPPNWRTYLVRTGSSRAGRPTPSCRAPSRRSNTGTNMSLRAGARASGRRTRSS